MTGQDAAERLFAALGIPAGALVNRRVAKSLIVEHAKLSAADRRAVEDGVERLDWRATLTPAKAGLPAFTDDAREYTDIVVMTAELRLGAKRVRLTELIHRAVTAPLLLIAQDGAGATLSAGLKRRHEREAGRVVVERLADGPLLGEEADLITDAFLASLDIARAPAADLWGLHRALAERVEAFAAARASGVWRLPTTEAEAEARRAALGRLARERAEAERLRRSARTEKRLASRIALAGRVTEAERVLAATLAELA